MRRAFFFIMPFIIIGVVQTISGADSQKDPKTLFEETCGECHSIDIPKGKRFSRAEWEATVQRMKSNGLSISEKEVNIIIEYLYSNYGEKDR